MNPEISSQISELLKPHRVCLLTPVVLDPPTQTGHRLLVFSLWRGHLVTSNQPLKVEMTFSYLDICSINIHSGTEVVLETETQTLAFSVMCVEDLEAMVGHMTTSLRRIFPDSCPGKLLKVAPLDLQQRLLLQEIISQEQLQSQPAPCGGFSDTYAALCDFNETPEREEIQCNVTDVYDTDEHRRFNLLDFRHLEDRDLALAVAALSFNQWFMKFSCRDHRLAADVQEQLILLLSRSISLQDLFLDSCGLKPDFTIKMAAALQENPSSTLQSLHLSGNVIEDRGVMALCQELVKLPEGLKHLSLSHVSMTVRGLAAVSQMLLSSKVFSASLTHLDLSGNPGCLGPPEAALFRFLSCANSVSYLDLSDSGCPLDTVFASLSAGCYENLKHLNLSRNLFRCRKMADTTRSIQEFFSRSRQLRYVSLSETRLPPAALRLLLQGLATNMSVCGLELDLSSCELHSAGAQVIQEHISEAAGLQSLNISDNGFEDDVVTLILAVGRCRALRHLSLGRNFVLRSRNLADALHRIAQLIQDEECPLQSLSLRESKLKADMSILLRALGAPAVLTHVDVSGNHAGDAGARILARALRSNTRLKSLSWDRNNITVRGFQDLADALERNFTLQQVLLPLSDVTKSFQKEPEKTQQAVHRIQQYLDRNNQQRVEQLEPRQLLELQQSEKLRHKHLQLQDKVRRLNSVEDVQVDVHTARKGLNKAVESLKLLPSLDDPQDTSHRDAVSSALSDTVTALTSDFSRTMQELADDLRRCTEEACPQLQQASVYDYLTECVSRCCSQAHTLIRNTLLTDAAERISSALSHLKQTLKMSVAEHVADLLLHHVTKSCDPKSFILEENSGGTLMNNFQELLPVDNFPTDDYSPTFRRNKQKTDSSVHNVKPGQPIRNGGEDGRREGEDGRRGGEDRQRGGEATAGEQERLGLPSSSLATSLPVRASSPSPTAFLPLSPQGQRWREGEVLDAAAATSRGRAAASTPPPPPLRPRSTGAFQEEAAHHGGCGSQQALLSGRGSSPEPTLGVPAPMEPLPTQGQALRHFTASRPRPRRTQTPLPSSRPQEPVSKVEVSDGICRVDEGVEEFFTKKIISDYALRGQWEESNPAQATPPKPSPPPSDPALISSLSDSTSSSNMIPVPPPSVPSTHTPCASTSALHPSTSSSPPHPSPLTTTTTAAAALPTKNIKKKFGDFFAFKRGRGQAPRGVNGGDGVKVKRPSIADLIRPLREAKDRERDRDREREKGTWAESVEDADVCAGATDTDGSAASSRRAGGLTAAPASTLTTATRPSETAPSHATSASHQEEEILFVSPTRSVHPGLGPAETDQKALKKDRGAWLLSEERRAKIARRFLREGKSQSLILLTGPEPEDRDHVDTKRSSDSGCFDQRLPLLPPKMGSQPATTETTQKTEEELGKTSSEGASLDKPEPRLMFVKPRTMSSSSAESAVCLRPQLKPAVPKRPAGPPPPQKAGGAGGAAGGAAAALVSPPPSISCAERVRPRSQDCTAANGHQDSSVGGATVRAPANERFPQVPLSWRSPGKQDRWEKSQSVTDGSIPKPCHLMKPLPQRRVVSAHEDALSMTEELKAVFQKSPVHLQASGEDQLTFSQVNRQEAPPGTPEGAASSSRHVHPGEEDRLSSRWFSTTAPAALGPPLEENTPKPALVHPQTVANMVASRPVPGKTPSAVPDSEELPGTIQEEQIPRTVSSR